MNDKNAVNIRDKRSRRKFPEVEPRETPLGSTSGNSLPNLKREKLVEILVFTLMPNHYHWLLRLEIICITMFIYYKAKKTENII